MGVPTWTRTQIGSVQCFVGQPYLEVTTLLLLVKLGDSQTRSIDCYRITNVTVTENGCRAGYCQSTTPSISLEGGNGAKMLDLDGIEHDGPCKGRNERLARPVNMF